MPPDMVQQFSAMLNSRFALYGNFQMGRETPKSPKIVRETITYPKRSIKDANNPCLDTKQSFEHALKCGHLVTTALPNEPCAPNCYHVDDDADLDRSLKHKKAMKMKNGNTFSNKPFYCDACVEMENEKKIPADLSSSDAEARRAVLRATEAKTRKKAAAFRKCYIALKFTSVQCHSDGTVSSRYVPGDERHPFDTAMPRTGENMFEDVNPDPKEVEATIETAKRTSEKSMEGDPELFDNDDYWVTDSTHAMGSIGGDNVPASKSARHSKADVAANVAVDRHDHQIAALRQRKGTNARSYSQGMKRRSIGGDEDGSSAEESESIEQSNKRPRVTSVTRRSSRTQKKKT
ncbi:hypothetical protein HBI24_030150 [Parastagonospora nodorum]|nr:hypothetical protein HBH46_114440 [Parastagonospora nodorum]KAH5592468.1 hypothetical protein HBI24_030150 [Parastagonospora nodorum]KAH5727293.1 hypothetical protein HBI20_067150 [Parastagonospora nodorum]KAH6318318.1 hypothetical protein HBI39_019690 [Parastagonospora nodorum]